MISNPDPRNIRSSGLMRAATAPPKRIGWANIRPSASDSYMIPADLMSDGQIWQRGLDGFQKLGQVDGEGRYILANGQTGNIFQGGQVIVSFRDSENPFAQELPFTQALQATERKRAVLGSEIPLVRNFLTRVGLTGAGIRVGILDPLEKQKDGQWVPSAHTRAVAQVIRDPVWGVAPNVDLVDLGDQFEENQPIIKSDNLQDFVNNLVKDRTELYAYSTSRITAAISKRDPSLRILNSTYGESDFELCSRVLEEINQADERGYFKYPLLRTALYGQTAHMNEEAQVQAISGFIQNILHTNPNINSARQNYIEATRQAALAGICIVKAIGNAQDKPQVAIPYEPSYFMDVLTSPYVISVAASNSNQTPGYYLDDQVAAFSSRGDGLHNPTIAAPGEEIGLRQAEGRIGHNLVTKGTSYSTPFVCGVIALMLQRNPFLMFEQIKAKLQNTAVKSPAYNPTDYGAGFLNPVAAVLSLP